MGNPRDAVTGGRRREVCYVSAPADEVRLRLQPLLDAGLNIEGVLTPALAMACLARLRSGTSPDGVTAVVAVNGDTTGLTVVRDGLVLFSREMPWGHETERAGNTGRMLDPNQFAEKLGSELRRSFLFVKQSFKVDVEQVALCGDLPDMRTVTAPLIDLLNVEVETLDSMEGFDLSKLPEPVDEFRSRAAELRIAWATAMSTEATSPINLLPGQARTQFKVRRAQVQYGSAIAAGLVIALLGYAAAELAARTAESRSAEYRRQASALEPRVQDLDRLRQAATLSAARRAALAAFATQGPRLARVLEAFGQAAPGEVAITSLTSNAQGPSWRVTVKGEVRADNPAMAQTAFNLFLHEVEAVSYLGQPAKPPIIRVTAPAEPQNDPVLARAATTGAVVADPALLGGAPPPGISAEDWAQYPEDVRGLFRRWGAWDGDNEQRVRPFEDHWLKHPRPDKEYFDWVKENEDNARNRRVRKGAVAAAPLGVALAVTPPQSALMFTIEFEVHK